MSDLPPGFVLDQASAAPTPGLPPGFVLDVRQPQPTPVSLWETFLGRPGAAIEKGARFAKGAAEGLLGEGVPEGRASEFEGGPAGFAGRAIGTGTKSIAESLWESLIKAPGKMLTGEMTMPEGEQAARGMGLAMAGGGFRPGMTLPAHQIPAAPRQLALPPPTVRVPGQPATQVGEGILPPGPESVMTSPAATVPPISPRAVVGPEPIPPVVAQAQPVVRSPRDDAITTGLYRRAVQPSTRGRRDAEHLARQDQQIVTGVDKLIENRQNLALTDAKGVELPIGSVPRDMRQFSEAINQTKTSLFEKWDPMARRAGDEGLRIDLGPVVGELRALAKKPEVAHVNPGAVGELERFADLYEGQGFYTPLEAQNVIRGINRRLLGFYEKGEAASGAPAEVLEPVARLLRKQLDEGIASTVAPGYQTLRNEYGALNAIEGDVTKAAQRIANKPSSGLSRLANLISSTEFVHGVLMANPHAIARAAGAKGAGELHRFFNDPNRNIQRMFDRRTAAPRSPFGQGLDPYLGPAARVGAIGTGALMSGGFPADRPTDRPLRHSTGAQ